MRRVLRSAIGRDAGLEEETVAKIIMTADDSASVRQMVGFSLRGAGYEVIEAVDGQDALARLKGPVHLVITDLNMPRLDGIELIRKIRAMAPYKFIPILMLTTESQDAKKQAGRAAGATGWIIKPFNVEQLLAIVKKVLGRRSNNDKPIARKPASCWENWKRRCSSSKPRPATRS